MVIRTRMPIPDGWRGARCQQLRVISWADDPPFDREQQADMVDYCNEPEPCRIRHSCLLFALMNSCNDGVWGGMSPEDRRALRRKYPLMPGIRNGRGTLVHYPRQEWTWMPPGHARDLLGNRELEELDDTDDGEDEDEAIGENG